MTLSFGRKKHRSKHDHPQSFLLFVRSYLGGVRTVDGGGCVKPFFKPEDFVYGMDRSVDHRSKIHADYANHLLEERGSQIEVCELISGGWVAPTLRQATHRGTLISIEEIPKAPCVHEPSVYSSQSTERNPSKAILLGCAIVCGKCGVQMEVETWRALE